MDDQKHGETVPIVIAGEVLSHGDEEREIYDALNKMNTILKLFVNALILRNRNKQGQDSVSLPLDSPTLPQEEWYASAYQVLTGPLSGYFQVSSVNKQEGRERTDLARMDTMKIFDIALTHLFTIKEPTVREPAQVRTKGFVGDFKKKIRSYDPGSPSLTREALCLDMLYVLKKTFSGSNDPEDAADRFLQPVLDISYAEFAVDSYEKVNQQESHDQDLDFMVTVRGKYSAFNAELNMEAYQRNKSKFDEILRRAGEQNVDSNTLAAMAKDV